MPGPIRSAFAKGVVKLLGESNAAAALASSFQVSHKEPPKRGTKDILQGYSTMPWLRAVTNKVSRGVASTPWRAYVIRDSEGRAVRSRKAQAAADPEIRRQILARHKAAGELEELEDHPVLDVLNGGNPYLPGNTVQQLHQVYVDLVGESVAVKERDALGRVIALWPIPPHWIAEWPHPGSEKLVLNFRGQEDDIPLSEVVWQVDPDPVDPYGRGSGMAKALGDELETDEYAAKHIKTWFYNRAKPEIVVHGDNLDGANTKRLEEDWNRRNQGFWNAFRAHFVSQSINIHELSQKFSDMELTKLRQFERDTVLQVYGMPPELLGILESSNRACHSDDTECLTREGWKTHDQLTFEDEIATWNEEAGQVEYHKPSKIVRYPYEGAMHHWHTRSVDVLITPDHRMWVKTQTKGDYRIRRSHELADKKLQMRWRLTGGGPGGKEKFITIPRVQYEGNGLRGDDPGEGGYTFEVHQFATFLGYFIAEGSYGDPSGTDWRIRLAQNAGEIADKIRESAESLGIGSVGVSTDNGEHRSGPLETIGLSNKSLCQWLMDNVGIGEPNKRIPAPVFHWPTSAKKALLAAMMEGDGSTPQERTKSDAEYADRYYGTSSPGLADDVQRLCVEVGLRSSIAYREKEGHVWWVVGISSKQEGYVTTSQVGTENRSPNHPLIEEHYSGTVWCVEVPNHLFFTRRNGKVALHGNTIEGADYLFSKWLVVPRLEANREIYQNRLVPDFDERIILDYESPVAEDKEHQRQKMADQPWAFTIDEHREAAGHDELPQDRGQVFMMPLSQMPQRWPQGGGPTPDDGEDEGGEPKGRGKSRRKQLSPEQEEILQRVVQAVQADTMIRYLRPHIDDTVNVFGERMAGELDSRFRIEDERVQDFLQNQSAERVRNLVNETTRTKIRKSLVAGFEAGETIDGLQTRVNGVFGNAKSNRSRVIARTETVRAANFGTVEAMGQAGIPKKQWLSSRDAAVRDSHDVGTGLDGQVVPIRQDFTSPVTGAEGPHPGDLGKASEDVHCRCTTVPIAEDENGNRTVYTEEQKTAQWKVFENERQPYEEAMRQSADRAFDEQKEAAIAALEEARDAEPA